MMSQPVTRPTRTFFISILCLAGIVLSAVSLYEYVVYSHGLATGPSFCNISEHINCEAVNASPWSVFFGLPIAAYGLFFYTTLLGLVLLAGPVRAVSPHKAREVILLLAVCASILSVALFCISEFVIGALCLMCIGLYLTNFALLAVTWRAGAGGSFLGGLFGGVQNIAQFLVEAFTGSARALGALLLIVVLGVLSAASPQFVLRFAERTKPQQPITDIDVLEAWKAAPVSSPSVSVTGNAFGDYAKGESSAPIQIVEFADYECPGCRAMHVALKERLEGYSGSYRLVFKNYPLDKECNPNINRELHRSACFAAALARCAGEQGKFWDAQHAVFTDSALEEDGNPQELRERLLEHVSDGLSLDRDAMKECISSGRHAAKLVEDIKEGDRLGLFSTPSFWINGKPVIPVTLGGLDLIFRAVLADRGKTPPIDRTSEGR